MIKRVQRQATQFILHHSGGLQTEAAKLEYTPIDDDIRAC